VSPVLYEGLWIGGGGPGSGPVGANRQLAPDLPTPLVAREDGTLPDGRQRYVVVAGGRRLAAAAGDTSVRVWPVTHSPPAQEALAVEIPARVKERLRLDGERSWVVLSEWNEFTWPGPDLRRAPGADDSSAAYGMLPPSFFATIRDRFLALVTSRASRRLSASVWTLQPQMQSRKEQ